MIGNLGRVIEQADRFGIPTLAISYARREGGAGKDDNYAELLEHNPIAFAELVSSAVRTSADLGASIVKCQYPGNGQLLQIVCEENAGVPIVVAGGPTRSRSEVLRTVAEISGTSVAGIAFGRNTYNRSDPASFIAECRSLLSRESDTQ